MNWIDVIIHLILICLFENYCNICIYLFSIVISNCIIIIIYLFILGVDRLSAWPIIGADIKYFTDYRYRPF